jgi:AcrR family transcriptional regulator
MIEIVATHGYEALTVRRLTKRARISSGTFYRHYRSTDDCFLATFDRICEQTSDRLLAAGEEEAELRRRLRLGVDRLFRDLAANPQVATFMLRAAPAAGPAFAAPLRNSALRLGAALDSPFRNEGSPQLPRILLEGIVAGLARVGRMRLPETEKHEIREVTAETVSWIISLRDLSFRGVKALVASIQPDQRNALEVRLPLAEGKLRDERAMILAAAFRLARSGYHQLTVPKICREAGVPRREFNRHFTDIDDCFLATLEKQVSGAVAASVRGWPGSLNWSQAVCTQLEVLCHLLEDDADSARGLFVEITAAGTRGVDRRDQLISQVAAAMRSKVPEGQRPSALAAEASTAAAWAILERQVPEGRVKTALPVLALLAMAPGCNPVLA